LPHRLYSRAASRNQQSPILRTEVLDGNPHGRDISGRIVRALELRRPLPYVEELHRAGIASMTRNSLTVEQA
jgi:hypothetical protein